MTTEQPDPKTYLPDLLNRIEAMIDCGAGTVRELATFLLPDQDPKQSGVRVSEWIRSRAKSPNGETALRMKVWVEKKMEEVHRDGKEVEFYEKLRVTKLLRHQ